MDGRERAIILGIYLLAIAIYLGVITLKFVQGAIDFETFKIEFLTGTGLFLALLIKLPPTKNEAEATAKAANGHADTVEVTGRQVDVHEEK